jgi:hypothetical protein
MHSAIQPSGAKAKLDHKQLDFLYAILQAYDEPLEFELPSKLNMEFRPDDPLVEAYEKNIKELSPVKPEELNPKKLILANLPMVVDLARNYSGVGLPLLDLIQAGNDALHEAAYNYQRSEAVSFRDYAEAQVQEALMAAMAKVHKYLKITCLACLLLGTLGQAGQTKADNNHNDIGFLRAKPDGLSKSEWSKITQSAQEASLKYGISENILLTQIQKSAGNQLPEEAAQELCNLSEKNLKDVAKKIDCRAFYLSSLSQNLEALQAALQSHNQSAQTTEVAELMGSTDLVKKHIDSSLAKILPPGSAWKAKPPGFIDDLAGDVKNIQVTFPAGKVSNNGRMVAQVALESSTGRVIVAVPVKITSFGEQVFSEVEIAMNE